MRVASDIFMTCSNLVILTTGLSGSSVVTALLAKGGYWTGDDTIYKNNASGNYETHENSRLVALNDQLLSELGIQLNNSSWYSCELFEVIAGAVDKIELTPYLEFINYCQNQGKWIWKDPRLWITMGFWGELLIQHKVTYVVLSRNPLPLWVSMLNKRQIVGPLELKSAECYARKRLISYLNLNGLPHIAITYDKLIEKPTEEIATLNNALGISLTFEDFKSVYTGKFARKTYSLTRLIKAILIFCKNIHLKEKL